MLALHDTDRCVKLYPLSLTFPFHEIKLTSIISLFV